MVKKTFVLFLGVVLKWHKIITQNPNLKMADKPPIQKIYKKLNNFLFVCWGLGVKRGEKPQNPKNIIIYYFQKSKKNENLVKMADKPHLEDLQKLNNFLFVCWDLGGERKRNQNPNSNPQILNQTLNLNKKK